MASTAATAATPPRSTPAPVHPARRELLFLLVTLMVAAGVLIYLVTVADARLDAPTIALSAGAIALLYALRQMFYVVQALGRPPMEHLLDALEERPAQRELRARRFRVLKSIKQLDTDHALGKLNDADHDLIRRGLVLQAVEFNRQLAEDGGDNMHPSLKASLDAMSRSPGMQEAVAAPSQDEAAARASAGSDCPRCEAPNDLDAKFCKQCGTSMDSADEQREAAQQ